MLEKILAFLVFAMIMLVMYLQSESYEQRKNEKAPRISTNAYIGSKSIKKEQNIHRYMQTRNMVMPRDFTADKRYYVAFDLEDGNRKEFKVSSNQYKELMERETGTLTFQGTQFIEFIRRQKAI